MVLGMAEPKTPAADPPASIPADLTEQIGKAVAAAITTALPEAMKAIAGQTPSAPTGEKDDETPAAEGVGNDDALKLAEAKMQKALRDQGAKHTAETTAYEKRIAALEERNAAAEQAATKARWTEAVRGELLRHPVQEGAESHVMRTIEEAGLTLQEDGSVQLVAEGSEPVSLSEHLQTLRTSQPFLFAEKDVNHGHHVSIGNGGTVPKSQIREADLTPEFIDRNMDKILAGDIAVV